MVSRQVLERTIYNTNFKNRIIRMSLIFIIRVIIARNSRIDLRSFI